MRNTSCHGDLSLAASAFVPGDAVKPKIFAVSKGCRFRRTIQSVGPSELLTAAQAKLSALSPAVYATS